MYRVSSGLTLYTSNRLENLADQLAQVVAAPLGRPLTPELVVVQSQGMRRWLTQELAARRGICANVRFPFPQNFFHDLFQETFPQATCTRTFECEAMTWRVMRLLPQFAGEKAFAPVANYLAGDGPELRAFELSQKIAQVFDRYLVFRPELILGWDAGEGQEWQPILWRELQKSAPGEHHAALGVKLARALERGAPVPERVSVFGISTLPPFYLNLIEKISSRTPVHLFVLEPTPLWWGEIRSRRERARAKQPELFEFGGETEPENALLAENGKLGRDFLHLLSDLAPAQETASFDRPAADTMLHRVQRDIFDLETGPTSSPNPADVSLQFHSCHSVVRELEVLHDQLLALFQRDRTLAPRDIVVMAPDISIYAPFIDAVFGVPENPAHAIPYRIADRTLRARSGVIDTFLRVLETLPGRFTVSEVLALLESDSLLRRFGIERADIPTLRSWIEACGIRWGIDAAHRQRLQLPPFAENSWRHGLDRMLLGYALRPGARDLCAGILPFDEIEGAETQLLGNFIELMERLFACASDFATPRSLPWWAETLRVAADLFLLPDEIAQLELNQLRFAFDELAEIASASENEQPVPLELVVLQLERLLERGSTGAGFLGGATTFCAMKPMRSIPFKVVCLLGLNDTAYPRRERSPEFDLIAQKRERGDRHTRDDDRALFLEALLSARDVFYVSFVGQSSRDNSALPSSVLVSELREHVAGCFGFEQDQPVVKHSLQAFSARNFGADDPRAFSYSKENSVAGRMAATARRNPSPFVEGELGEAPAQARDVDLDALVEFFAHPCQYFLRHRLGLVLPRDEDAIDDREPFALHNLRRYEVENRFLSDVLAGQDLESAAELIRARGILPPGGAGTLAFGELCRSARNFAEVVRRHVAPALAPPLSVHETLGRFTVRATIDHLRGERLVRLRLANLKAKDFLRVWFEHLLLNLHGKKTSLVFGNENREATGYEFPPVDGAEKILVSLLEIYWHGLREPLPLFPRTSWKFAEKLFAGKSENDAHYALKNDWVGSDGEDSRGERNDPWIELAFRGQGDPRGENFVKAAREVFLPILSTRRKV